MKDPYIVLLLLSALSFILLHVSTWWFFAVISATMLFTAYRFYASHLHTIRNRNATLEKELEELHERFEQSFFKEQSTNHEVEQERLIKKQMRSIISHKALTEMDGIMRMAVLMAETSLTKEQKEYLDTIRSCSKNLLATLNDVLVNDRLNSSEFKH